LSAKAEGTVSKRNSSNNDIMTVPRLNHLDLVEHFSLLSLI
jgi:hypothetical protein